MTTLERLNDPAPAGFWSRLGALFLDWLIVGTALCFLAAAGFVATGGAVRMAEPPFKFFSCTEVEGPPTGFDPMAPIPGVDPAQQREVFGDMGTFAPTVFQECRVHFLGLETDRTRIVAEEGGAQRWFRIPTDVNGAVSKPLVYLDNLYGLALLLALTLQETAGGRTLGKRAAGLRVATRRGDRPGLAAALTRNAILWGPGAALGLFNQSALWGLALPVQVTALTGGLWGLLLVFLAWPLVLLIAMLASGGVPFWDRAAGTRVTRARHKRSPPPPSEEPEQVRPD